MCICVYKYTNTEFVFVYINKRSGEAFENFEQMIRNEMKSSILFGDWEKIELNCKDRL